MAGRPERQGARQGGPRILRIALISLGSLVLLLVVGVAVAVLTFDPNRFKPEIIAAVQRATGRQLTLNGPISMGLALHPTLEADDVEFANPAGFSRPQMATLQRLELQLAVLPLLQHRLEISRLVLVHPDILLETDANGHDNWQFAPPPPAASASAPSGSSGGEPGRPLAVSVQDIRVEDGTLAWRDEQAHLTTAIAIKTLEASAASPDAPVKVTLDASYNGGAFSLDGDFGPVSRFSDPANGGPWPVKVVFKAAGAAISLDGTLAQPLQGRGFALTLDAKVPDLSAFSAFAGSPLPALQSIALSAKLAQPDGGAAGIVLNDLHLTVPQGDLSGQVAVGLAAPRPMLRAELTSNRIDADALRAVPTPRPAAAPQAAPAPGPAPAPAAGTPPPQRVERGPMEQPLPFPLLRLADADVSLKVGELKSRDQTYRNLAGHAVVHDGALTLAPFDVDLPAGHLDGKLTANANASPPTVSATAHAPSLNVQTLLATAGHAGPASGNVEVNAAVSGTGDTPHQLVASLDGPIGIALVNGQIDNRLLGDTLAFVLQKVQLLDVFRRGGNSDLRCFALRIDARHGIGDVSALLLNSSLLTMDGGGSVNFADQTMSLRLRPQARVAGTGVYVPLLVTGSWHNPVVNTDPAGLVTSNAGTAAGIALGFATMGAAPAAGALLGKDLFGSGDACARPVALARLSTPAPEAAAPPPSNAQPQQKPKLPNPADLLRQLFR